MCVLVCARERRAESGRRAHGGYTVHVSLRSALPATLSWDRVQRPRWWGWRRGRSERLVFEGAPCGFFPSLAKKHAAIFRLAFLSSGHPTHGCISSTWCCLRFARARAHAGGAFPRPCVPLSQACVSVDKSLQYQLVDYQALAEGLAKRGSRTSGVRGLKFGKIPKDAKALMESDFWCVEKNAIGRNAMRAGLHPGYGPGIVKHSGPGAGGCELALLSCSKSRWPPLWFTGRARLAARC